jgi:1-acyl-sn-glycerol-3-phosphate acyltransferase
MGPPADLHLDDFRDAGHGYDAVGMHVASVRRALALAAPLYDRYFRVESQGSERVPRAGAAILVANHGGVLPVDGAMLWMDVVRRTGRIPRTVGDHLIARLPFVGARFARTGVVSGSHATVRHLLAQGALVTIFPEGVSGPAKPTRARYRLQRWQVGHAELAIRHRVPVIPVAIVGAEESWPLALQLRRLHVFGIPYLPVPWTPLPLPVQYHLRYGPPIELFAGRPAEAADDPAIVAAAAQRTRDAVAALLARALDERRHPGARRPEERR